MRDLGHMRDSKILVGSVITIMATIVGVWISSESWNGITYYYWGDKRQPAAIQKAFDFSHLEGSALQLASQRRVLSEAKVTKLGDGKFGIELGHFITRGADGAKQFACQVYDRIELVFFAEGMAIAGDKPIMVVEGNCQIDKDINRISAIPIPAGKILAEEPGDLELKYLEESPVSIRFDHISGQWPMEWSLFSVKLYDKSANNKFFIDHQQIKETSPSPIKMNW